MRDLIRLKQGDLSYDDLTAFGVRGDPHIMTGTACLHLIPPKCPAKEVE